MEHYLLLIQARCLQWTGLFWLVCGLLIGKDPLSLAWQACLAALICMVIVGMLLRVTVNHVGGFLADQMAAEVQDREEAELAAAAEAA